MNGVTRPEVVSDCSLGYLASVCTVLGGVSSVAVVQAADQQSAYMATQG